MTLVVIDLQHVFADPTSDWAAPRFFDVLPDVETLVDLFGDDSVFTRFVAPEQPEGAWRDYYRHFPFAQQSANSPLWDLVAPFTGRPAYDSPTFGKWDGRLADRVHGDLVVAGVATDCCVISTVLAAADAGVHVRVVSDACAGSSDEAHNQAIAVMALYAPLVEITTVDDEVMRRSRP